eukprot:NODE_2059_length_1702_cov_66.735909_g1762_i0.p1 GENE.NODE_2059_length_1702_cov_66.735909_g1762_i0~~NODE_2059_length_1702_cov_66.735909_g1762_i0.p1  ORF type:complete len:478 (+),score=93.26 NODE_2059_length_1702_cov_66.735909_g1762_i0:84-1517(+)
MADLGPPPNQQRKGSAVKLKHIGRYTLLECLGQGTFAKVKKAVDRNTGEHFAVKIMDKKKIIGEGLEPQLKREVSIMLNLNHPNIVKIIEVLQSEHNVYMVLEFVQGGELFDNIKDNKRLDEKKARNFFQQLVTGVHMCHEHGICHRDLKPENLLISGDGKLKIADFGLANLQKGNEFLKTVCGTPNYVAPEVLTQAKYDGFKSDMWSCGVILYVMLAGRLPFYQKHLPDLVEKIKAGDYKMPDTIPPLAADLIRKLLNTDPDKRLSIPEIIQHPWFRQDGWEDSMLKAGVGNTSAAPKLASTDQAPVFAPVKDEEADAPNGAGARRGGPPTNNTHMPNIHNRPGNAPPDGDDNSNDPKKDSPFVKNKSKVVSYINLNGPVWTVIPDLEVTLGNLGMHPKLRTDYGESGFCEIICYHQGPDGILTMNVMCTSENGNQTQVAIKKGRGKPETYTELMNKLVSELGSYVVSSRIATATE